MKRSWDRLVKETHERRCWPSVHHHWRLRFNPLRRIFLVHMASILEVKNYGLVNYYIALASIFAGLGTMRLNTTVTTYLAKGERNLLYEANS